MSWRTTILIGLAIGLVSGLAAYITLTLVDAELRQMQPPINTMSQPLDFAQAFESGGLAVISLGDLDTSQPPYSGLTVGKNDQTLGLDTFNPQEAGHNE